jgi:hypothetical protein
MTDRVRHLLDRQDILDCIVRCARGMDRHDARLFASAYHPDALDDHGPYRGSAAGFIEHVNGANGDGGLHANLFTSHQHLVLNHSVDIDGDEAHSETHFLFFGALRSGPVVQVTGGRYIDRFERRDGTWAIAARRVIMEWMSELPDSSDINTAALASFTRGTWDGSDISYQRPLEVRLERP